MAFWGVEVKPGKSFTHKFDDLKGRLHISMATLGFGASTAKSILQCNVGNRSPVYLCSLSPGMSESLQLNLEFEEVDEVIFSAIGPRSVHLCGYYLGSGRNTNINEDSESYGEDIADTETERSDYSDQDEYENSFIDDDGDPDIHPPSPISNEGMEEALHVKKPKGRKGSLRRLRRKYQRIESEDDQCFEENITINSNTNNQTKKIDHEDSLPISSLYKSKTIGRVLDQEMDVSDDGRAGDGGNKNVQDGGNGISKSNFKADKVLVDSQTNRGAKCSDNLAEHCTVLDIGNVQKFKKKKREKEKEKEGKYIEAKGACSGQSIKKDTVTEDEPKMDKTVQDLPTRNGQSQGQADDKETETLDKELSSSEVDCEQVEKLKKKSKERSKKGIKLVANDACHSNLIYEEKSLQDEIKADSMLIDMLQRNELTEQPIINERGDNVTLDFLDANQSKDRKIRKRKKKSKSEGNVEVENYDISQLSVEQSSGTVKQDGNEMANAIFSQGRSLSNGLVIQELEMGTEDGKIAASGRKISVHYIGKLKKNGEVFEANVGHAPFKFRLGKGEVIEGWDVGLEGMRVGEKRRLIIPPSMGFGSEGHGENVPPNSWLVYDFELVKVH